MNELNYMERVNPQVGKRLFLISIAFLGILVLLVSPVSSLEDVIDDDCNIKEDVWDRDWKKYSDLENTPLTFEEKPLKSRSPETQRYYATQSEIVDAEIQIFLLKRDMEIDRQIRIELNEYKDALVHELRVNLLTSFWRLSLYTGYTMYKAYGAGVSIGNSYVNLMTTTSSVSATGSTLKVVTDGYYQIHTNSLAFADSTQSTTEALAWGTYGASLSGFYETLESVGDPKKIGVAVFGQMSREALATLPSGELTSEEIGILREQHLKNKEIDKAWADSFEANLERLDNVKELEAQIKELEKELAKWEAEEKNRVKASLVDNCKDEKKEKCDFEHLNLCKNEKDCDYIGRYWYGNQCNENPEEDTSEEDTSEEDTSDGEFNCPIPEGAKHMVEYKKDYWVMPNTIKRVGPSQEWYDIEKTKKHRFRCYNIEGERHGVSKWWYEDGTPEYEWNYKDGKFHGVSKGWREDGTPEYERNYKDGKNHGVGKSWREDGTPEYEWNYKDGKKHGVCKRWYEDGTPMDDWNYKDGKRHGVCKRWYEDGTPMDDWNYKDGKNHGVCKRWYEDGSKSECNYKDGKKHGVCKSWDANGKLRSECNYEEDKCVSCDPGHC